MKNHSLCGLAGIVLISLVLSACGSGRKDGEENIRVGKARSAAASCDEFKRKLSGEFKTDSVQVPEDWSNPASRKISVFYYHNLGTFRGTPTVFFNGGPSGSSHSSYRVLKRQIDSEKQPFVFIDQRGTGCSETYPLELNRESVARLSHYGSTSIVKDAEAVRKNLLGTDAKWKVFGQSYGGYIVHRYLAVAPEGIAAAYAHGAAITKDSPTKMAHRLMAQKRVTEEFFARYPGDREKWAAIRASIPSRLCFHDDRTRICGNSVLDSAVYLLAFLDTWEELHTLIAQANPADSAQMKEWTKQFAEKVFFSIFDQNDMAATVITIVESIPNEANEHSCPGAMKELARRGENPNAWAINECRLDYSSEHDHLMEYVTKREPFQLAPVARSLAANPALPFFLYSSAKDCLIPAEMFQESVSQFGPRVTYRAFSSSGHEGFNTEPDVWRDLASTP